MNRADARTRKHRYRKLRHHPHVDHHPVPFFDFEDLENVGEFADLVVKLLVCESTDFSRFPFPDQSGLVLTRRFQMTVQAVVADVGLSADKPLGKWKLPLHHLPPLLEPFQFFCHTAPEFFRISNRFPVHPLVLRHALYVRLRAECLGGPEDAFFFQCRLNTCGGVCLDFSHEMYSSRAWKTFLVT